MLIKVKKNIEITNNHNISVILIIKFQNIKFRGIEYLTLTGSPLCSPGVHLGDSEMAFTASLSNKGSTPLTTVTLLTEPSFSTMNVRNTVPLIFLSIAAWG